MRPKITSVPQPNPSLLEGSLRRVDYADAYGATFANPEPLTVEDAFRSFFRSTPAWIRLLMSLRNALVKRMGLKGPSGSEDVTRTPIEPGAVFGLFRIYAVGPQEILAGEDDRHLDFRTMVQLRRESDSGYRLTVATAVDFKNVLGRLYFLPVKPFHRLIVREMIRSIVLDLARARS